MNVPGMPFGGGRGAKAEGGGGVMDEEQQQQQMIKTVRRFDPSTRSKRDGH